MKLLLVFDNYFNIESLVDNVKDPKVTEVALFPITSDPSLVFKVITTLQSRGYNCVKQLNSAETIDKYVKYLQTEIVKWSAEIGKYRVRAKAVKEWFLLPGCNISTWWLSLLSEKNPLKTDAFLRIAQINAVKNILTTGDYDLFGLAVTDKHLQQALDYIAVKRRVTLKKLPVPLRHAKAVKVRFRQLLKTLGGFGEFLRGFSTWLQFVHCAYLARRQLGTPGKRMPDRDSLLFVSYFPAVDTEAAQIGVFRNKYALALQNKLKEYHIPIVWLFIFVPLDGYDFKAALRLAKTFADKGEKLFLLEEFLTFSNALKGLLLWLRQIGLSYYLLRKLEKNCLVSKPIGVESEPIIKSLWKSSFCGIIGIQGIIYAMIFKQVFAEILYLADCLYYCEMHAWEKALNAAKNQIRPRIRTIGFQHTCVVKNYFFYFYEKTETIRTGRASDLPLPDVFACNGELMCSLLAKSGYPGLQRVESVRYLYLNKKLSSPIRPRLNRPVLLVAGSIDKTETGSLLALVKAAFPVATEFDIWIKGHPSLPVEEILAELSIDIGVTGYQIRHENISNCLSAAWVVLVPTSTVAIEALAFGCEIIIPVFPNAMLMSPLADFENYYHKVTSEAELRATIQKIIRGYPLSNLDDFRQFVRNYWDLDPKLPKWTHLLLTK